MNANGLRRPSSRARRQRGFIMVTGLLFLVVMTLLGLALFRGTGLLDRITANTRDKQRAFEAAQSALEYGSWWLSQDSGGGAPTTCATNSGATTATLHICSEPLSTSLSAIQDVSTWSDKAFSYTPPNMTLAATGTAGGMANATDINYLKPPGLYVESLGTNFSPDGSQLYTFYQVTTYGYAGDANTISVLRSTFKRTQKSKNLNGT